MVATGTRERVPGADRLFLGHGHAQAGRMPAGDTSVFDTVSTGRAAAVETDESPAPCQSVVGRVPLA